MLTSPLLLLPMFNVQIIIFPYVCAQDKYAHNMHKQITNANNINAILYKNCFINYFPLVHSLSQRNMTTLAVCWSQETSRLSTQMKRTWRIIKNMNDLLKHHSGCSPGLRRPSSRIVKPQQENPSESVQCSHYCSTTEINASVWKPPAVLTVLLPKQTNSLSAFPLLFLSVLDTFSLIQLLAPQSSCPS